jgi:hypothetical protein
MQFGLPRLVGTRKQLQLFLLGLVMTIAIVLILGRFFWKPAIFRSHDMEIHAARLAQFYLSLRNGDIPPRWNVNTNLGFGMPTFEFTYFYPYVFGVFWYVLTKSIEQSLNLVMFCSLTMAGVGMYFLAWFKTRKLWPSFLTTLLYLTLPYTLLNIFIRGAMGEVAFMGLVPWIVLLVNNTQLKTRWWYQAAWMGLWIWALLTHHLLILIFAPLMIAWYLWQQRSVFISKKGPLGLTSTRRSSLRGQGAGTWQVFSLYLVIPSIIAVVSVAFAFLPMATEKSFTKLDNPESLSSYTRNFTPLQKLFASGWTDAGLGDPPSNLEPIQMLGFPVWVILAMSVLVLGWSVTHKKTIPLEYRPDLGEFIFWLLIAFLAIWLITPSSRWLWDRVVLLQYQQFPWRLNWVVGLATCLVFAELTKFLQHKEWQLGYWLTNGILIAMAIISLVFWAKPVSVFSADAFHWFEYPETGMSLQELVPREFSTQFNYRLDKQVILRNIGNQTYALIEQPQPFNDGKSEIQVWNGHHMKYTVDATGSADVIQKTAYFPGWEVTVNGQPAAIKMHDSEFPGRVIVQVPAGKSEIEAKFTHHTWPRKWGERITLLGILAGLGWLGVVLVLQLRREKKMF